MKPVRLAVLAALAVAAVAAVAWAAGPVEVGDPRVSLDVAFEAPEVNQPEEQAQPECAESGLGCVEESESSETLSVGSMVLSFALAVALVWLAVKLIRKIIRWSQDVRLPIPMDETVDAEIRSALREASEQAARDVEGVSSGEATDAVVACWVRLEQAAERVGTPRAAAATPSEFTVELLREHDADPRAVSTLLDLYHQARFGTSRLPESATRTAAEALRDIADSLSGGARFAPAGDAS